MPPSRTPIAVLGDGGWGTTLAIHLHTLGHRVAWWGAFPDYVKQVVRRRENPKFLPGIRIPSGLRITADLSEALDGATLVVLAVPSQHLRGVLRKVRRVSLAGKACVSVAKGIETHTQMRMSQVVAEELGRVRVAVLSGPNIAPEIARGHPASSVVASADTKLALAVQQAFTSEWFRVYTSADVIGVELGGALKNPIAIAAGIGDGLGFGANAKAALITRGIVEMARLGTAMGAKPQTFWGLSGLGDLITTCMGGRNRALGEQLGQGKRLAQILSRTEMVIEGVDTTRAAIALGRKYRVELPIIEQVHAVLFRNKRPHAALKSLMVRSRKAEFI